MRMYDNDYVIIEPEGPPTVATTVYEEEGDVIIQEVEGGWRRYEGKWSLGFGPKVMVYRPVGPVKEKRSDLEEPIQSAKRPGSAETV